MRSPIIGPVSVHGGRGPSWGGGPRVPEEQATITRGETKLRGLTRDTEMYCPSGIERDVRRPGKPRGRKIDKFYRTLDSRLYIELESR